MLFLVTLQSLGSTLLSTHPWASYLTALSEFLHPLCVHSHAGHRGHCAGYTDFCVIRHPDSCLGPQQALPKCFQLFVCPLSCLTGARTILSPTFAIASCRWLSTLKFLFSVFFSFLFTSFLPPPTSPHLKKTGAKSPWQNSSLFLRENFAMAWAKSSFGQRHLYGPSPQHWVWKLECTSGFQMLTLAGS